MAKAKSKAGIDDKKAAKGKEKTFTGKLTASIKYDSKAINMIFTILITAFILIVPFYRGLFFRKNYIPAILFISVIFSIYVLYKCFDKSFILIDTYMDIAVLAIPSAYVLSFLFAANSKDAFDSILIYSSYFILYKLTHSLIKSDIRNKDIFINVIILSAFLLSSTFFLDLMGIIELQGAFVSKRLFGLYQYPNTTASVLGIGIVLAINMLINTENIKLKMIYQAVLTALVSSFIFTLSRGGYLVLAGVLVLNFLLIDARSKLKYILGMSTSFLSSLMLIYKFYTLADSELKTVGGHYFISIILSAALIYLIYFIKDRLNISLSGRRINIILLTFFAVLVLIIISFFITKEPILLRFIPNAIANRMKDINFETRNVSLRIIFMKDGLNILKDYPMVGAGGGAWKNLYRQYQSIPYNTTETHNFYVQYAVEVGIIGLIALAAVLLLLVRGMIKCIADKSGYLHIYLAAMLLFLHSAIDFNLSLVAVGYLLWMLAGILNSHEGIIRFNKPFMKLSKPVLLVLSFVIVIFSSSVYYGIKLGGQAVDNAKGNKDIDKAIALFEKAGKFDRFNANYRYDLAQVLNNQLRKTNDKKYYLSFKEQLSKIKKYEPYNHDYSPTICNMLLAVGEFDEAVALADERILHQPMVVPPYEMKIDVNYQIAQYLLKNEQIEESMPYLEKILEAERQLTEINNGLEAPLKLIGDTPKKVEAALRTLNMIKEDIEG